jgi:holliday junction DNA helicase RuvA
MIESLTGKVNKREGNTLYLSTGPIEWSIEATAGAAIRFASIRDKDSTILIHLVHREDAMVLYGFEHSQERSLFRELIKVSGIGPKQAIRILSGMESKRFIQALENEDLDTLSSIPGVGKKSAGKIILALRGKLAPEESSGESQVLSDDDIRDREIISALVDMGFDRKKVEKALQTVRTQLEEDTVWGDNDGDKEKLERELFRRCIIMLSS